MTMVTTQKFWIGTPPETCDVCGTAIVSTFIDGRTARGPWANMCADCHTKVGVGLGTGKGQKYQLQGNKWMKVQG